MNQLVSILRPFSLPQRIAFFSLCVATVAFRKATAGDLSGLPAALALAGILIAVWHGAFDGVLARPVLKPRFGRHWMAVFVSGYLLLGALVAMLWWWKPQVALPLFLLYSAWHFGTEGTEWQPTLLSSAVALCQGFVPIAASCYWHPVEVAAIFSPMLRTAAPSAPYLTAMAGAALLPACAVVFAFGLLRPRERGVALVLTGLELLLFWRVNPLLAFAIFFCCWHTPEHLAASSTSVSGRLSWRTMRLQLRSGFLPWLVSLLFVAGLLAAEGHRLMAVAASVFLLLSALTVPHMVLNELRRRSFGVRASSMLRRAAHAG